MLITKAPTVVDHRAVEPVNIDQLTGALALLGIESDPNDLAEVHFTPGQVRVVLFARDVDGRHVLAGDTVATVTIIAPVERVPRRG
ncbi:hypothetical protein [Kineosporia sp. R_H_3]|uniref:hypothetical protein n=1 Tax=Kineosporia sp. R_H_3 TaxID=1961848 RepID=UPI000B4BAA10|nr:hypothetical protein [Kineosporia sp. R_H_3]